MITIKSFKTGILENGTEYLKIEMEIAYPLIKEGAALEVKTSSFLIITPNKVDYVIVGEPIEDSYMN